MCREVVIWQNRDDKVYVASVVSSLCSLPSVSLTARAYAYCGCREASGFSMRAVSSAATFLLRRLLRLMKRARSALPLSASLSAQLPLPMLPLPVASGHSINSSGGSVIHDAPPRPISPTPRNTGSAVAMSSLVSNRNGRVPSKNTIRWRLT